MSRIAGLVGFSAAVAFSLAADAKDIDYIGSVEVIRGEAVADGEPTARGRVFLDANRNSRLDDGEAGLANVLVSNGREVVATAEDGSYALPATDDMNLFITKPAGYATPLDEDLVPQFSYLHKPAGSPELRFDGIAPTGPLPQAVNFPLIEDDVGESFQCLVFGDTQPYSNAEVSYVRETLGRMLAARDNASTECLLFAGDVMGDDLSLYPRFKDIVSVGGVPQYFVPGNHDFDFDAPSDQHSFDTFRREWGPEYYSFEIGQVHFVVLDNVRYPCNGVDDHDFCDPAADTTYNGVLHDRQLDWLANTLALVPEDKLIVVSAHIPFVSFTDADEQKHQTDNLQALYDIIGDRPALGLSGHTHTTEQILPGEVFEGWKAHTGTGPARFHQIVTGAVSGSWWAGDLNDRGVPHATQRLGSPRGYYLLEFDGATYVDTFRTFDGPEGEQLHASFNTPRFRDWAARLIAFTADNSVPGDALPSVTVNDLGDRNMLTTADLAEGTWVAINVWNGSRESEVSISINGGEALEATRTQAGEGEVALEGPEFADPYALAKQSTQGRQSFRSLAGGEETAGYRTWRDYRWNTNRPGPFQDWMLTLKSSHLWRVDLPSDLPEGVHRLEVETRDRYGRNFSETLLFEVVEELPNMNWQANLFQ
ncbi:calcineurin-like phosphoesterase C-terminal domain-containing protein [Algihabitans albus]|uniref:calcineurin-like phosphoesterase C-terminal domain-containing protein n=1 Tax=Algihabitans albus TaxID=2164067 RepID=UPI000E5CC972|nr:calcineurin-like phosphoesterase family protein [Algihabitans albus]